MNAREGGFLLLTSHLGNPERKPLSGPQLRVLTRRMQNSSRPAVDHDLNPDDLLELGYGEEMASRIVALLEEEDLLMRYLHRGMQAGCGPITRASEGYPVRVRKALGEDAPGCLWARGDVTLLETPMISLVGSRDLYEDNHRFAEEVGCRAALQGYTLVSGNARGADRTAQNACLAHGGCVVSVVADELAKRPLRERVLYISEDGFEEQFSAARALSRNRVIHALGEKTFVAQCTYGSGGTWDGTVKNLRFGWSGVYCFDDGSEAARALMQMGAQSVKLEDLESIAALRPAQRSLFEE